MELFAKSKNRLYTRLVDLSHELSRREHDATLGDPPFPHPGQLRG